MYLYILVNYFQNISSSLFGVTVVILLSNTKRSLKALTQLLESVIFWQQLHFNITPTIMISSKWFVSEMLRKAFISLTLLPSYFSSYIVKPRRRMFQGTSAPYSKDGCDSSFNREPVVLKNPYSSYYLIKSLLAS